MIKQRLDERWATRRSWSRSAQSCSPSWDFRWQSRQPARRASPLRWDTLRRRAMQSAVCSTSPRPSCLSHCSCCLTRRAFWFLAVIGSAWLGLVAYSCLATHATVTSAIAAIERTGTWTMEGRAHVRPSLPLSRSRSQRWSSHKFLDHLILSAQLSHSERVPPGVWRDSQECQSIRDSKYFLAACAKVLELRRELAAAEDYERLKTHASELRQILASSPIMATSDPLPEAFAATLGQLLPVDGRVGVALLLTFIIEIVSCLGLAALRVLGEEPGREATSRDEGASRPELDQGHTLARTAREFPNTGAFLAASLIQSVPQTTPEPGKHGFRPVLKTSLRDEADPPSNVVPMARDRGREPRPTMAQLGGTKASKVDVVDGRSHVAEFVRARLHSAAGKSLSASELRAAYETWCAGNGRPPISQQRFGAELAGLGFAKWKSCGLIRYRDLQLAS